MQVFDLSRGDERTGWGNARLQILNLPLTNSSTISNDTVTTPTNEYSLPRFGREPYIATDSTSEWSIIEPIFPADILTSTPVDTRPRVKARLYTSQFGFSSALEARITGSLQHLKLTSFVQPQANFSGPYFEEDPFGSASGSFLSDSKPQCIHSCSSVSHLYDISIYENTSLSPKCPDNRPGTLHKISKLRHDEAYPMTSTPPPKSRSPLSTRDLAAHDLAFDSPASRFRRPPKVSTYVNRTPRENDMVQEPALLRNNGKLRPLLLPRWVAARTAFDGMSTPLPRRLKPLILPTRVAQSHLTSHQTEVDGKHHCQPNPSPPVHTLGDGLSRNTTIAFSIPVQGKPDIARVTTSTIEIQQSDIQEVSIDWELDIIGEYLI